MASAPGQPVHSHMPRELSETGHAIVRSRTVTVFCRYHDNYISVVTGADQSGTEVGYKIVLPRSPWYLWLKTTLTLGLRPRVRVVYNHKSLATVVELLHNYHGCFIPMFCGNLVVSEVSTSNIVIGGSRASTKLPPNYEYYNVVS